MRKWIRKRNLLGTYGTLMKDLASEDKKACKSI
jgi:hypothetical protein